MKKFLLIVTGLLVGFMAGSWTPLGSMSADGAKALIAKSDRLSGLVGMDTAQAPSVSSLSVSALRIQNLALAIQPEEEAAWQWQPTVAMMHALAAPQTKVSSRPNRFSSLTPDEVSGLINTIYAVEMENQQIAAYLSTSDRTHPETYLKTCQYYSNNQWAAIFRFLILTNEIAVSQAQIAILQMTLDAEKQKVSEASFMGRLVGGISKAAVNADTPITQADKNLNAAALEILDSYSVSFDVEDALAGRVTDYARIMRRASLGEEVGADADLWDLDTSKLFTDRASLAAYRVQIVASLTAPTS